MALIDDIKQVLRIRTNALNIEVQDIVDSAKADLKLSGILVSKILDTDMLIKRAIILYCKANFGLDNKESEKYQAAYNSLKIHLTLSQEYTVEVIV